MINRPIRLPLSATKIMFIAFLCVAVGHLAVKAFIPSLAINAVGVALVVGILSWVLFQKKDLFSFLLIIFVCSQFNIANNQGGLFNLAAFLLLAVYLAQNKVRETGLKPDIIIGIALAVLFVMNSLGVMLRSPVPIFVKGLEFSAFTGILLAFYAASKLRLTEARIRTLALVISLVMLWDFFVSLNQYYLFIAIETPFLGLASGSIHRTTNSFGTFGSASSNGQFAMMMLVFILPLFCATVTRDKLKLNALYFIFVSMVICSVIVLANMRSAAILAAMTGLMYLAMFSVFYRQSFKYSKYLTRVAIFFLVFLIYFGAKIGLQEIAADFQAVDLQDTESIESGAIFNRLGAWEAGMMLWDRGTWWIGYGHGVTESNMAAWGARRLANGTFHGGGHLHSLYLALPTLYGWFGSIAYVVLLFTIAFRLFRSVRHFSFNRFSIVISLGFLSSCTLFLIDEAKSGNAVQNINFPMVAFIWFGLGLAAVRTTHSDMVMANEDGANRKNPMKTSKSPENAFVT